MELWITPTLRVTDSDDAVSPEEAFRVINKEPHNRLARPAVASLEDAREVMRMLGMPSEMIDDRCHFALTGTILRD